VDDIRELPGHKLAKNILMWHQLHRMQAKDVPPFEIDGEQARSLHAYLQHLMQPMKSFREDLEVITGKEMPVRKWPSLTWKELDGALLYGVKLWITGQGGGGA